MLRVTVMMFRDMVESVMLLNDDDWRKNDENREERQEIREGNRESHTGTKF